MNADTMQLAMVAILLLCGYFYLYQAVARRTANKSSLVVIAIVLLGVYLLITVPVVMIISDLGDISFVLFGVLLLLSCIVLFAGLYGIMRDFRKIHKGMLMLFILYTLMIAYITIFSREEGHSTDVLLTFDSVREAIDTHSLEPLQHVILNAAMFIPLGMLFPLIRPGVLDKFSYVAPLGMMMTTLIEATQMLLKKGQCDIEDIVANTLGAILGLVLFKIGRRMGLIPVREEEEEDEDEEENEDYDDEEEEEEEEDAEEYEEDDEEDEENEEADEE